MLTEHLYLFYKNESILGKVVDAHIRKEKYNINPAGCLSLILIFTHVKLVYIIASR